MDKRTPYQMGAMVDAILYSTRWVPSSLEVGSLRDFDANSFYRDSSSAQCYVSTLEEVEASLAILDAFLDLVHERLSKFLRDVTLTATKELHCSLYKSSPNSLAAFYIQQLGYVDGDGQSAVPVEAGPAIVWHMLLQFSSDLDAALGVLSEA